jgi:TolB-like protein
MLALTWGLAFAVAGTVLPREALAAPFTALSTNRSVTPKNANAPFSSVSGVEPLRFEVTGPVVLELTIRACTAEQVQAASEATLLVDEENADQTSVGQSVNELTFAKGKGVPVEPAAFGYAGKPVKRHLQVPDGKHVYQLSLVADETPRFAVLLAPVKAAKPKLLLAPFTPADGSTVAAPAAEASAEASDDADAGAEPAAATASSAAASPPAPSAEAGLEQFMSTASARTHETSQSKPAPKAAPTALAEPVAVENSDGSVAGATRALAAAVALGWQRLGREVAFHRVAVPAFKELSPAVSEQRLGALAAELLATELSTREPFVVVERERLDQIMKEHRLQGLGLVDESTAAEFGKIMGAQSIMTGTIGEAGPVFIVNVRQVEVETGAVLVAGSIEIGREGLIALSSEAIEKRSRMGAVIRSALLPGWGQLYNQQSVKGYVVLGVTAGIAVATGIEIALGQLATMDYRNPANTDGTRLRQSRQDANARFTEANILLIGLGVTWAFAVLDALIFGEDFEKIDVKSSVAAPNAGFAF